MKVVHILNELKFSGAEIMYVDAAEIFQKLGCELYVVNTSKNLGEYAVFFKNANYKVLHWPYPKNYIKRWIYYFKVIKELKKEKFDIVHIHSSALKWGMSFCAWMAGCKSVYTFHNVFKSHWYSYAYHWWLRWSAKYLFKCSFQTISDSVYENELRYYHNKTYKVNNWYNHNRFYPADINERNAVRKELGIAPDTLVIISIGGCSHIKRHSDIIIALSEILKSNKNVMYLHLGQGTSLKSEEELANKLNVSKNIIFCGNQVDVRKFLIASDIYLMTSRFEGISLTTIEAMACHIPSILYDVPGLRDFNKYTECSELIPENPHVLAQEIVNLYNNKSRKEILIYNADKNVNTNYNMRINALGIYNLYKNNA